MNVQNIDGNVNSESQQSSPIDLVEAAKEYARLGWRLIPVNPKTKVPLLNAWPDLATSDPATLEMWWRSWPKAMIGVVCGPKSGVAVVDVDAKPDENGVTGLEHWNRLEADQLRKRA